MENMCQSISDPDGPSSKEGTLYGFGGDLNTSPTRRARQDLWPLTVRTYRKDLP